MSINWVLAAVHLLPLTIGVSAVWARGRALREPLTAQGLQRVFFADNFWGLAAIVWIVTGLLRAFGGFEKGSAYYLGNGLFWVKMVSLILIMLLEAWPMVTLVRWRIQLGRGQQPDTQPARAFAAISFVQLGLTIVMALAASGMARGFGANVF
jgi:putative membrane protein